MSRALWFLGSVLLAVACYDPQIRDCVLPCQVEADCPDGKICSRGACAAPVTAGTPEPCLSPDASDRPIDAAGAIDARLPDGNQGTCEGRCSQGACRDGVCVIDCAAMGCADRVVCPQGIPCRVTCGNQACSNGVDCSRASSCDIRCAGNGSCAGSVVCGGGRCEVRCGGNNSCANEVECDDACGCDVDCSGNGSCSNGSTCPASACELGGGCTSDRAGCDRC